MSSSDFASWFRRKFTNLPSQDNNIWAGDIDRLNEAFGGDAFGTVLTIKDSGYKNGEYQLYGFYDGGKENSISSYTPFLAQEGLSLIELTGINGMLKNYGKSGVGTAITVDNYSSNLVNDYMKNPTEDQFVNYIQSHGGTKSGE